MRRQITAILLALISFGRTGHAAEDLAIEHVNVIPMNVQRILPDMTVLVGGGRILKIGRAGRTKVPRDAKAIDATGLYLIPGLIDSHVHLFSRQHFILYLANGVTTVLNLDGRPLHLVWRDEVAAGRMLGPRIFTVGPKFDRADPPQKAADLVDQYANEGYNGIKIYNQVSKAEYPALIAEAKKHHMLIVGHIARDPGFELTLQSGQAIAHAEEYLYTFFKDDPRDAARIPQAVSMTKAAGVPVIATLVTYRNIVDQATDFTAFLQRPEMKYWAPWELEDTKDPSENPYLGLDAHDIEDLKLSYPFLKTLVRALHQAGVPILAGSDAGGIANAPGFSLHDELQIFTECGFTPFEALQSATTAPARFLRQEKRFGTIEEGKLADLVLLRANPLDDIDNTRKIAAVVIKGKWLSDHDLQRMLKELPDSYRRDEQRAEQKLLRKPSEAIAFLKTVDPLFDNLASAVFRQVAMQHGATTFENIIRQAKESDPDTPLDRAEVLNGIANYLLGIGKKDDAIDLFRFNVAEHPQAATALDRLARAYYKLGQYELSLNFYKKALEIDPGYWNADFARRRIKELTSKVSAPPN